MSEIFTKTKKKVKSLGYPGQRLRFKLRRFLEFCFSVRHTGESLDWSSQGGTINNRRLRELYWMDNGDWTIRGRTGDNGFNEFVSAGRPRQKEANGKFESGHQNIGFN